MNGVKFDYRCEREPVRFGRRGCFPQVVLKVARIPMGNLNFGRSSTHVRTDICVRVCGRTCIYVGPRRFGLLCAGMGCGSQYHRGMTPAGSPRAALFHPFPYYSRPRASSIICGAGIGRARHISELVPLDRLKSHEISMRNPY